MKKRQPFFNVGAIVQLDDDGHIIFFHKGSSEKDMGGVEKLYSPLADYPDYVPRWKVINNNYKLLIDRSNFVVQNCGNQQIYALCKRCHMFPVQQDINIEKLEESKVAWQAMFANIQAFWQLLNNNKCQYCVQFKGFANNVNGAEMCPLAEVCGACEGGLAHLGLRDQNSTPYAQLKGQAELLFDFTRDIRNKIDRDISDRKLLEKEKPINTTKC